MNIFLSLRCMMGHHHRDARKVTRIGNGFYASVCRGCAAPMWRRLDGWTIKQPVGDGLRHFGLGAAQASFVLAEPAQIARARRLHQLAGGLQKLASDLAEPSHHTQLAGRIAEEGERIAAAVRAECHGAFAGPRADPLLVKKPPASTGIERKPPRYAQLGSHIQWRKAAGAESAPAEMIG